MSAQGRILIIDSDTTGRRALHGDLLAAGFEVSDAEHPEEALAFCRIVEFDMVLLHARMEERGIQICRALRSDMPRTAILVLSEYDDPNRTAEMLEAGADQCFAKPLHPLELAARMRATLRRSRVSSNSSVDVITIGDVRLEPGQHLVYKAGEPVHLTPKEFALLHHLMVHAGIPVTHSSLLREVWGPEHVGRVEYLRIFMRQLRTKLNDNSNPKYLLTESCIGYRFVEPANARVPAINRRVDWAA